MVEKAITEYSKVVSLQTSNFLSLNMVQVISDHVSILGDSWLGYLNIEWIEGVTNSFIAYMKLFLEFLSSMAV